MAPIADLEIFPISPVPQRWAFRFPMSALLRGREKAPRDKVAALASGTRIALVLLGAQ
jgi:hypothetical protein